MLDNLEHIETLIARQLDGSLTEKEQGELRAWRQADPQNDLAYKELLRTWELAAGETNVPGVDIESQWQRFQGMVDLGSGGGSTPIINIPWYKQSWFKVAAVLIPVVGLALFIWKQPQHDLANNNITVATVDNEIKNVQLPDGSQIELNENSRLTYSTDFGTTAREIQLLGEAFFDVAPQSTQPFTVFAGNSKTVVLGTSFNIKAYQQDSIEIVVTTGKVAFSLKDAPEQPIILTRGNRASMQEITIRKSTNESVAFTQWRDKTFKYQDQSLGDVINDIEKNFGIRVIVEDSTLVEMNFNGTISTSYAPGEIMEILSGTTNTQYRFDSGAYYLSK